MVWRWKTRFIIHKVVALVNLLISSSDFWMTYNLDFNGYAQTPLHLNSLAALEPEGTRHNSSQSHRKSGPGFCQTDWVAIQ